MENQSKIVDKKISFSLRHKLLVLMVTMLSVAIFSYLIFAIQVFKEDRKSYIYENGGSLAKSISYSVESYQKYLQREVTEILQGINALPPEEKRLSEKFWHIHRDLMAFSIHNRKNSTKDYQIHSIFFNQNGPVTPSLLARMEIERPLYLDRMKPNHTIIENPSIKGGQALVRVHFKPLNKKFDQVITAYYGLDTWVNILFKSKTYSISLINSQGEILVHAEESKILQASDVSINQRIKEFLTSSLESGGFEYKKSDGEFVILSLNRLPESGLIVMAEIPRKKAFLAIQRLQEKSLIFAVLLMAVFFIIAINFSKRLTQSIHALYQATMKISKGDFDVKLVSSSSDEVGALSRSFNYMAQEIKKLLLKTEEKAHLDAEMKTAALVQNTLFPESDFGSAAIQLTAHYRPARSCGGDWWSYKEIDDEMVICIGDATGHGVPAALVTATAQSAFNTVFTVLKSTSAAAANITDLPPAQVLNYLNQAICNSAKGQIKMTFFIAFVNLQTGLCRHSNASHEMPIICRKPQEMRDRTRDDLDILVSQPGPILGKAPGSVYQSCETKFYSDDSLLFYTDGLTEGRSEKDKEWGENKLLRSFVKCAHLGAEDIKKTIIDDAYRFYGERQPDDDITLIVAKFIKLAVSDKDAA